jgi:hypothetical protein
MLRLIVISGLLLAGCTLSSVPPNIVDPTNSVTSETPNANPQLWEILAPGLERRTYLPTPNNEITKLVALRIDPAYYTFRVHYRPDSPLTIRQWEAELPGAAAFINGNFFDENGEILGLLVADGVVYGAPYTDRGGMFAVKNGATRVRSNTAEPYMGEALEQAVQAFPMLVFNGIQAYTSTVEDTYTRRTIVAQDTNGNIILMTTPLIGLPLLDLSIFLPSTDMNLANAVNLDGGGSTLMYLNSNNTPEYLVTSLDPVPAVLAVYPRS